MDDIEKAIETFIMKRMAYLNQECEDAEYVRKRIEKLNETLTDEQKAQWRDLEEMMNSQSGDEARLWYRLGFLDGVRFILYMV